MSAPFRIGIAGLGTVGAGVVSLLTENENLITARAGRKIKITAVSARDKARDRGIDLSAYDWVDNPLDIAKRDDVDAVVELIGGTSDPAHGLVQTALESGKHVVTANKALIAHYGDTLAQTAEDNDAILLFEAAVAGGIPIIKALKEGLSANQINSVYGILNGTCNYILTEMRHTGRNFKDVLKDAQAKGYAEADPTFDIGGIDTAHKTCVLSCLAFGLKPHIDSIPVTGIENIEAVDINFAEDFGFRIKLLGAAHLDRKSGNLYISVGPCLIPTDRPIAVVDGVYNAVLLHSDYAGWTLMTGRGAGAEPTASAVVADIIDLAKGNKNAAFSIPTQQLQTPQLADPKAMRSRYYMRFMVKDEPGVIADISAILRDHNISIKGLIQRQRDPDGGYVPVVMTTHHASAGDIHECAQLIGDLPTCKGALCVLRIEEDI